MITSLQGRLASVGPDAAIIDVGGVGFQVFMPTSDLSGLGAPGHEIKVFTHLHVREDSLTLFGFAAADELWLFETLLGVSGLGPKLALAMLSSLNPEQISTAIVTGSADMLDMVPGVGRKLANRIILELKEKIGAGLVATTAAQASRENTDVLAALTSLGYSAAEAVKAVATLPADTDLDLEAKIKLALKYFGSS
jgi:Holliday junction DNA helicase RuvA